MTKHIWKCGLVAAGALMLAACGGEAESEMAGEAAEQVSSDATMAEVLAGEESLSQLSAAFKSTGLAGVLEGEASYTLLAPNDDAFKALGEVDGALVANLLRGHMIPGAVTTEAIKQAADEGGGQLTMATFGGGDVTFTVNGETIIVSNADGIQAKLGGSAMVAKNGVVLPIDKVLTDPDALNAAAQAE